MLAFYSNNPSSNPAEHTLFSAKNAFEMYKNKQEKEARVGPFKMSILKVIPIG